MPKSIKSYYKYLYREQIDFRYRLYLLNKEKDLSKKIQIANDLMYIVFWRGIGIYSCLDLEKPFLELAQTIPTSNKQYKKNSYLHVMTQAYLTGGHTRVVERWIDSSPQSEKHSVVLLSQGEEPFPLTLRTVSKEHNGELFVFSQSELKEKATQLRELALEYEYIILHIHMYDPTAIVAFGTENFERPVILFNHSDHTYWCGSSVVDIIADLRVNKFTSKYRGVKNIYPVRIPFEVNPLVKNFPRSQEQSRKKLGLPTSKKIILTVGGAHKYEPFAGFEFCDIINKAIINMDNIICVGIGPNIKTGNWKKYGQKFIALGEIDYGEDFFDYLNSCDVYINSIPVGGGTAILDAIQFRKPVLSYSVFNTGLGNIVEGIKTSYNMSEFLSSLVNILTSDKAAEELATTQYEIVNRFHGTINWQKNLKKLIDMAPKKHKISKDYKVTYKINDLAIMVSLMNKSISTSFFNIYDIYHYLKLKLKL